MIPKGTYRIRIEHEQHQDAVLWERGGIPAETVEQVAQLLAEVTPIVAAARGAHAVVIGARQVMEGLGAMAPKRRAKARGKR